ncbi:hypothetical protein BDV32DRAFT_124932 [Aspergillus pseudonomiae]|nr:hypothetical protein BDV32DRAFT_124932 [Aspergillus pseudonomiae]
MQTHHLLSLFFPPSLSTSSSPILSQGITFLSSPHQSIAHSLFLRLPVPEFSAEVLPVKNICSVFWLSNRLSITEQRILSRKAFDALSVAD